MNQSVAVSSQANSFRGFVARTWADPDSRSTLVGVAGVLLFYLLLWLLAPYLLHFEAVAGTGRPHATAREFNIELAPETFAKAPTKAPEPFKFVETNPDAPENTPDKTQNFAARNQQVAQEKPDPNAKSDRPATEGKKDFDAIVSGQLVKPVEHLEAVPENPTPPADVTVASPRAEQNPLAGFEKKEGEDKQSFGTNVAPNIENAQAVPEKVEGQKNVPLIQGATAMQPSIDPRKPQPRLTLASQVQARPTPLADNKIGTLNMGIVARDAKWSNYGDYLQRLVETVDIRWNQILARIQHYPTPGSDVAVTFILDSAGRIARIVNVESTSTEIGKNACVSGIIDRSPYGEWTDDMKAMLGSEQQLTFRFFYQ